MSNPYFEQLQHLPAYGRFDPKVPGYLAEVSLDADEEVIASIKVNHGQGKVGHLTITTDRLRWFQRLILKSHNHWPLATTMALVQPFPAVIGLGSGELFQGRGLSPRPLKEFVGLHQQMIEAMRWAAERAAPEPIPVVVANAGGDLAQQLDRLAEQQASGLLNPAEFEAAKRQLLGLTG